MDPNVPLIFANTPPEQQGGGQTQFTIIQQNGAAQMCEVPVEKLHRWLREQATLKNVARAA